ncbi:hypothetical protein ACLUXQ_09340 [Limosilactobacillus mucosae]
MDHILNKGLSFFKLVCVFLLASFVCLLPLIIQKNLYTGIDMGYHLNRAYDLAQNLKHGSIFPFITTYSFNHLGTQINMAYGLLSVYPLAIGLILFKNPIIGIYFGISIIQLISALISYYFSFKYYKKSEKSILFSLIYVFSIFNLHFLIGGFSLGEISATAFLPIAIYGTYSILYGQNEWWYLAIGMSLTLYTHLLSVLIYSALVFTMLVIACIDKHLNIKKIKSFIYATISAILMSSFFLVNFITMLHDQKISSTMVVDTTNNEMKLSNIITQSLDNQLFGIVFIIGLIISLTYWKKLSKYSKSSLLVGLSFLLFVTPVFDAFWKLIDKTPFRMIQFPYRFLVLVNFCFAFVIVDALFIWINNKEKHLLKTISIFCILFISLLSWSTTFVRTNINNTDLKKPSLTSSLPFSNYKINTNTFKYLTKDYYNGVGDSDYWPIKSIKLSDTEKNKLKHNLVYNNKKFYYTSPYASANAIKYVIKVRQSGNLNLPFFYSKNLEILVDSKNHNYKNSNRGTVQINNISKGLHNIQIYYRPTIAIKLAACLSVFMFAYLITKSILFIRRYSISHQNNVNQPQ